MTDAAETGAETGAGGGAAAEPRLLVVGEALVDVIHRADGTSEEYPGGSPANVALTLGRLGRDVTLLTTLGADARGDAVRAWLAGSGVKVLDGAAAPRPTSVAAATLAPDGSASYEFDLSWELDASAAPAADHVHVGSIATALPPGADALLEVVRAAREHATVSFDPNVRPSITTDADAVRERTETLVALADVVKASDEDLAWLYPGEDHVAVAQRWLDAGPALVVVTRGGEGAFAVGDSSQEESGQGAERGVVAVASARVDVVDTVGAGDTFMATLIDSLAGRGLVGAHARPGLRALDADDVVALLERSARAAAITVSRAGANPPTRAELDG